MSANSFVRLLRVLGELLFPRGAFALVSCFLSWPSMAASPCGAPPDRFSVLLQRVGLVAPVVTPEVIDLVVDFTPGSSGTPEHYDVALRTSLAVVAAGVGQVRVFLVDDDGATIAGTYQAQVFRGHGRGARAQHQQEQLAQGLAALGPLRERLVPQRGRYSRLALALSKVAVETTPCGHRTILFLTDAREFSGRAREFTGRGGWDLECGIMPSPPLFLRWLDREHLLMPASLQHTTVIFSPARMEPVDHKRCGSTTPLRYERIKAPL